MDEAGSLAHARSYSLELVARAKARLEPLPLDAGAKALFMSMADFFVDRLS